MGVDEILQGMIPSLDSTNDGIVKLLENDEEEMSQVIKGLLNNDNTLENVSLLDLKNNAILSYLNNLMIIILSQIERAKKNGENIDELREQSVENSIIQRICLERGIKPIEKKLNYQFDKMIRSYNKLENDFLSDKHSDTKQGQQDNDEEQDDEDSESEDELSYKPNASSLIKSTKSDKADNTDETSESTYRPPKISAMAPPTSNVKEPANTKKLQSMEEYLRENSDLPTEEKSIGVNIVNHGRGIKTSRDRAKEKEIQTYEEENFTRLPTTTTKKDKYQKRRELENNFAGEDFSIFNSKRNINDSTTRKRKAGSVWDKVKRRK